jgi:hypothetical protein
MRELLSSMRLRGMMWRLPMSHAITTKIISAIIIVSIHLTAPKDGLGQIRAAHSQNAANEKPADSKAVSLAKPLLELEWHPPDQQPTLCVDVYKNDHYFVRWQGPDASKPRHGEGQLTNAEKQQVRLWSQQPVQHLPENGRELRRVHSIWEAFRVTANFVDGVWIDRDGKEALPNAYQPYLEFAKSLAEHAKPSTSNDAAHVCRLRVLLTVH